MLEETIKSLHFITASANKFRKHKQQLSIFAIPFGTALFLISFLFHSIAEPFDKVYCKSRYV